MRIYIPDMNDFFSYMDKKSWPYAVLRGHREFIKNFPPYGSKQDVDILITEKAVNDIRDRYKNTPRRKGVKCDLYSTADHPETNYLGHPYFPGTLSERILSRRVMLDDRFYVPCPEDRFYSLLYHIAYHKAETSGFAFEDSNKGKATRYYPELQETGKLAGVHTNYTLYDAHKLLVEKQYGIDANVLKEYIKNDFSRGRKSYFYAWLCNQAPGEMNLFVIRKTAVTHTKHISILHELRKRYKILAIKKVNLLTRLNKMKHMRGGKWRRGGKPYIAVVVFDQKPFATTPDQREIHKFVFNAKQFFKPDLREWFINATTAGSKDNPLHSTDNEAEAIGHLPLFFSEQEQVVIFDKLADERNKLFHEGQVS